MFYIKYFFELIGLRVSKLRSSSLRVTEKEFLPSVDSHIVARIFKFYGVMAPFSDEYIKPQLAIGGAWKEDLKNRRQNQLDFIKSGNKVAYGELLEGMLRNELVSGQWSMGYYAKEKIGNPVP